MPNKCTLYTFSEILMGQYFWANIKILLIGVDKEKFMIHNENVINSVDKTLITNHLQKKDKKMKVNRVLSVDYSNLNKSRVLMNKSRVLAAPTFGATPDITRQAVTDQFIASANTARQKKRDMVEDPLGAISGKFTDLIGMFIPKNQQKARELQSAIDYYYSSAANSILNK